MEYTKIVQINNLTKSFRVGSQDINVLKNISFSISNGDFVIIVGPSGCGKSTLLHTILGLEPPTSGDIIFLGRNVYRELATEDERSDFRKKHIGMVYQQSNWVKALTSIENVFFPLMLMGYDEELCRQKAEDMLKKVNMLEWKDFIPTELSGGQQQKVALARALINNPDVIIGDEPTGNLDYASGEEIMNLFIELNSKEKKTVIMVTHNLDYLNYAKTTIRLFDGQLVGIYKEKDRKQLAKDIEKFKLGNKSQNKNEKSI